MAQAIFTLLGENGGAHVLELMIMIRGHGKGQDCYYSAYLVLVIGGLIGFLEIQFIVKHCVEPIILEKCMAQFLQRAYRLCYEDMLLDWRVKKSYLI